MKNYKLLYLLLILLMLSCSEEERGQYPIEKQAPGQVTNITVFNEPGGATISYIIPNDDDLLYVKAIYKLDDGTPMEQKASSYVNQIKIEGLGKSEAQTIQIVVGDYSKNESAPIDVEIHPQESPIYNILRSINMTSDFGGVALNWINPLNANVVVTVSVLDENENFTEIQNFYSNASVGKGNVRGFPDEERIFAVSVRDKWMNKTDTLSEALIPLFEEQLDRHKFKRWNPPGIPYLQLSWADWNIEKMWDGEYSNGPNGYSWPLTAVLPDSFTMDLGQTANLGRIKVYQRALGDQLYIGGNVQKFQLWGSPHPNVNQDFSTWIYLGSFESYKPSGLPIGEKSQEDIDYAMAGEDYSMQDNSSVPIRYLRFYIEKTWSDTPAMQIMEIEFFGAIQ